MGVRAERTAGCAQSVIYAVAAMAYSSSFRSTAMECLGEWALVGAMALTASYRRYAVAVRSVIGCIVRRADLPLTPAAQYFCDMTRRASSQPKQARDAAALKRTKAHLI